MCFYLEDADVMFTGDHVLQKTTPHVGNFVYPLEERDALAEFMDSLRRVQKMDITRGLGAHGVPITDVAAGPGNCSITTRSGSTTSTARSPTTRSRCGRWPNG